MKGEKFIRAVVILLCCVLACYLVFSIVRKPDEDYTIYKAVYYEVGGLNTSGFVVRSEHAVSGGQAGIVVFRLKDGERAGKNQTLATIFRDNEAKLRQEEIDALEAQIAQMEYAYSAAVSGSTSGTLDAEIHALINEVTVYSERGDYALAAASAEQLKADTLRRFVSSGSSDALQERITEAKSRLSDLYARTSAAAGYVKADTAGYFSAAVDGYEQVLTPEFLETATVSQFRSLPLPESTEGRACRLITSPKWYYAALVAAGEIEGLEAGDRVDVSFAEGIHQTVQMKVERISPTEEDTRLLVLSSERSIQDAASVREQEAEIFLQHTSGLLVPKSAIYSDEKNRPGVYVLEGVEARWKNVEIIHDCGDSYLVTQDTSSISNLWPEDEIILTTEKLFDGKVMKR